MQSGTVDVVTGQPTGVVTSQYEYRPGSQDRVIEITRSNATTPDTFSYDERDRGLIVGHKTATAQSPAAEQFTYDSLGRLISVSALGSVKERLCQ